jgi:RNA polymerase-binding protein DksA
VQLLISAHVRLLFNNGDYTQCLATIGAARRICKEQTTMNNAWPDGLREQLETKKAELVARLERITANLRRGLDSDSKERAKQLEDSEVVDALGNDARAEIEKISMALRSMEEGTYGQCSACGEAIGQRRIKAYPYASKCIECATLGEQGPTRR